jgi:2-polyprenyl-3-methyl-5-hydroxy-6-metoxy-1,4-benzoquinol methylase
MITVDFERLGLQPGQKVLDIGSGPGRHTCAAVRFPGVTAIGADISYEDIREAKKRLQFQEDLNECAGRWGLSTASLLNLPFDDNAFDVLVCAEVLEHIPEHEKAIRELIRVVKPGGKIAVSVPRYLPEKICWLLSDDYHQVNMGHIRIYRKNELIGLLQQQGLHYRGSQYAHGLHSPYWWLKCLVGPTREDHPLVYLYHRFLVWDLMEKPRFSQMLDTVLNPLIGKSLVIYAQKPC